jgi:nucleoside-diphosphate-sugar epimerase
MPTILITGSSGFIGGATARTFRECGWRVYGIGRRNRKQKGYIRFDLSNPINSEVENAIRNSDVVLHAAARSSPWGTRKQFAADNVLATQNLIAACENNGKPRFIFVSSSSVFYQPKDQFEISESTPFAKPAVNLYAETKQVAESLVRKYSGQWTTLRPRAVYGVGDTVLFPRILAAANAGKLPLLIRDGEPAIGDLISIDNLVNYFHQCANDHSIEGEFNLTDNQPQEILAFLLDVFQRLGIPKPRKKLSVSSAFRIARVLEFAYRTLRIRKEPPITRFGVHVFAYSKTFDASKMIAAFGSPKYSTEQSVDKFVKWVKAENPYGLN